jgi:hypothetical protein
MNSKANTYRYCEDFNYSLYCLAYTHLSFHILRRPIRIVGMPSEVPRIKGSDTDKPKRYLEKLKHASIIPAQENNKNHNSNRKSNYSNEGSDTIQANLHENNTRMPHVLKKACQCINTCQVSKNHQIKPAKVFLHQNLLICLPSVIPIQY